jgi:hypothetical protein
VAALTLDADVSAPGETAGHQACDFILVFPRWTSAAWRPAQDAHRCASSQSRARQPSIEECMGGGSSCSTAPTSLTPSPCAVPFDSAAP